MNPTKWVSYPIEGGPALSYGIRDEDSEFKLATVHPVFSSGPRFHKDVTDRHARLIAAAPELEHLLDQAVHGCADWPQRAEELLRRVRNER